MLTTRRGITWEVEEPGLTRPYVEGPHPGLWGEWGADRWEADTIEVMDRFVRPGTIFVDLGASIGPLSLWATAHGADALAVEPDPVAFEYLTRNGEKNAPGKIRYVNAAVAGYNGECELTSHPQGWGQAMSSLHRYREDTFTLVSGGRQVYVAKETAKVPCHTVEWLFEEFDVTNCCLVKMDIEGEEAVVCETVGPFLSRLGVPLLVEIHGPWLPRPMDPAWFDGFSRVEGELYGFSRALCIP